MTIEPQFTYTDRSGNAFTVRRFGSMDGETEYDYLDFSGVDGGASLFVDVADLEQLITALRSLAPQDKPKVYRGPAEDQP